MEGWVPAVNQGGGIGGSFPEKELVRGRAEGSGEAAHPQQGGRKTPIPLPNLAEASCLKAAARATRSLTPDKDVVEI